MSDPTQPTAERAADYSPLGFLREHRSVLANHFVEWVSDHSTVTTTGSGASWHWRRLDWDSAYFDTPVYRLDWATWEAGLQRPIQALARELSSLRSALQEGGGSYYLFGEIPAEDIYVLQALGVCGFRLIETRLTYYLPDASDFTWPERYAVRLATGEDAPHLRDVAERSRNPHDRYHADPFFTEQAADEYLGTYAHSATTDREHTVVVPDTGASEPPGAFFAASVAVPPECPFGVGHSCTLGLSTGRIFLVAVGRERRGWHQRLLVETTRILAAKGAELVFMTTQAGNRAVVRNCEKTGFRLGRVTHVMASSSRDPR